MGKPKRPEQHHSETESGNEPKNVPPVEGDESTIDEDLEEKESDDEE